MLSFLLEYTRTPRLKQITKYAQRTSLTKINLSFVL